MVSRLCVTAICLGGYVVANFVFVRVFPLRFGSRDKELLEKRFPYPVTRAAHRGGCLIGPENTLFTFRRALEEGNADMLELDVHMSGDGVVVVCHDETLERICGVDKAVRDIIVGNEPTRSLPQLLRKIPNHFKSTVKGDYYVATEDIPMDESTCLCLLTDVFEAFPNVPLHIDIKSEGADVTRRVLKMIETYKRETITLVGSSNYRNRKHIFDYFKYPTEGESIQDLKEKRNRFRIFAGPVEYGIVQCAYFLGILPFIPLKFDVFSIPVFTKAKKLGYKSYIERCVVYFLNSPTLWKHLQRRGILVIGWVLNDDDEFEEASKWPINSIISDDPVALDVFLNNHNVSKTMKLLHFK